LCITIGGVRRRDDGLWNGEHGAGGMSWVDRSRMGPLRGVLDFADEPGRRNLYMHTLHETVLRRELACVSPVRQALDFGCGTGRFLKVLSEYCADLYALDREPSMIEAAQRYAGGFAKRIECWRGNDAAFEPEFFDFVLCSSVLCVTTASLFERSLREIARITRAEGTLLLLEQIAGEKGLSLQRYRQALSEAGFHVLRAYPIRCARSVFTAFAAKHRWLPASCYGTLARAEVALTRRLAHRRAVRPYVEYAIVARRDVGRPLHFFHTSGVS
jgi:SAM-dependent methyltransferase